MKTINFFKSLFVVAISLTLVQCTSDDPIPGPAGTAGTNGTDGVDGTASCLACHSASHRAPIEAAYALSKHGSGTRQYGPNTVNPDGSLASNRAFCAQCHNNDGYVDIVEKGKFNPSGYFTTNPISCKGCHGNGVHRSLNFTTDDNDFALRQIAATTYKIDNTKIDVTQTGKTFSTSNTCITCHQGRPDSNGYYKAPKLDSTEKDFAGAFVVNSTATVGGVAGGTYTYWQSKQLIKAVTPYPASTTLSTTYRNSSPSLHASAQADLFIGMTGIAISGSATQLPLAKSSGHFKGASCVACHMDKPSTDALKGSHTMVASNDVCKKCHTTTIPTEVTGYVTGMAALKAALIAKSTYFTSSPGILIPAIATSDPVGTTTTAVVPLRYAQAYWNYILLNADGSSGLHNPPYAKALIQNSLEALAN